MLEFIMENIFLVGIIVFFIIGFLIASTENFGDFDKKYPDELFSKEEKEKIKEKEISRGDRKI